MDTEKKKSIFAGLNPVPPPAQFQRAPEPAPAQQNAPKPESDARVAGLEASIKALRAEIDSLKQMASRPQPPVPAPAPVKAESAPMGKKEQADAQEALLIFESMKRRMSEYVTEFSGIERECRRSLGEMQGYVKNISHKLVADRFDEHLQESVARLSKTVAEMEQTMHSGIADLASRLKTDEVLYGKIFAEVEDRLRKGMQPDIDVINGQLKVLSSKVAWLMDEYSIVMERKMRVLETKYSAFDVLSARVDALSESIRPEKDAGMGKHRP